MPVNVEPQVYQILPEEEGVAYYLPIAVGMMKGDILVFRGEADVVRLPVGTDGQVLTADSTSEIGVKWADPS